MVASYVEATVIVDGALAEEETFSDGQAEELNAWLTRQKELAMAHPDQETQVYLMDHGHPPDMEDCSCAQYLTDHHPYWKWGKIESENVTTTRKAYGTYT